MMNLIETVLIGTMAFFLMLLMIITSYYGNPIGDESLPIGIAFRFLNGQRPFVDDLSPYIPLGLILVPLVKLSILVHQNKNELILFMRHLYLLFMLGIGLYIFFSIKKYINTSLAFFVATASTIFHPFNINNFHYDTLSVALWSAILFQFFNFSLKQYSVFSYFTFAVLNLILCFSYPTFIFFLLPFYIFSNRVIVNKIFFWSTLIFLFIIAGFIIFWLILFFYKINYIDILNTLHFFKYVAHYALPEHSIFYKCLIATKNVLIQVKGYIFCSFILTGVFYFLQRQTKNSLIKTILKMLSVWSVLLLPLHGINLKYSTFMQSFYFLNCVGFSALIIFLFYQFEYPLLKKLFCLIWIPSFFAGILTSSTSSNLQLNFIIGFFPASLLIFIFIYIILDKSLINTLPFLLSKNNQKNLYLIQYGRQLIFVYILLLNAFFQNNYVYGEERIGLDIYMQSKKYNIEGPFNGIYLSSAWIDQLKMLQADIKKIDHDSKKYIYLGPLSGAYLLFDHLQPGEYLLFSFYQMGRFNLKMKKPGYSIFNFSRSGEITRKEYEQLYLAGEPHQKIKHTKYYDIDYLR